MENKTIEALEKLIALKDETIKEIVVPQVPQFPIQTPVSPWAPSPQWPLSPQWPYNPLITYSCNTVTLDSNLNNASSNVISLNTLKQA